MKKVFLILSFIGLGLLFVPKASAQSLFEDESQVVDGLYDENATGVKTPMPLPYVREADVMWKKTVWREIDFRQKMNQGFYFPTTPHKNLKNLYTILEEALQDPTSGVTAYSAKGISASTGELTEPLTWEQIKMENQSSFNYTEEDDFGNLIQKIGYSTVQSNEIKSVQVKEEWYFDKQRSELLVKIIAICPVRSYTKEGEDRATRTRLCWVPYDENLRKILIDAPFYNRSNSATSLSYDDIFMRRVFDSYIIREDNVQDRSIADYAKGIDALYESERIKQSIIDFEQNLWEY